MQDNIHKNEISMILRSNKIKPQIIKRAFLPIMMLISLSATTANAVVCSPTATSSIKQAQYNAMKQDAAQLEPVAENFMDNINKSLETIGCADAWPTGNLGINLPSYDSIIKKAKDAAISKACSLAREKVSSLMGNISESVSLDVDGLGTIASGSVLTGVGSSSSSGANVNGTDVWSSISDSMK